MQITALQAGVMGVGDDKGPHEIQLVGDRCHLDCTPTPDDRAYNLSLVQEDGHSPVLLWRWGYEDENGNDVYCSKGGDGQPDAQQDRDDPWDLQSYEVKNAKDTGGPGWTPVLELTAPLGPGVKRAWAYPILWAGERGQYNGGLTVKGPRCYWKAD